jgi:histidinol dehydrogenase
MRIVRGVAAAREFLSRRSAFEEPELPIAVREVIRRVFGAELDVAGVVERILRDVRANGDEAVQRYNREIDGVRREASLEVSQAEIEAAYATVDAQLVDALRAAAARIQVFHELQMDHSLRGFERDGVGQIVRPIDRVGLYVPGTTVVYPSTVLMTAVPARVAGVRELVMVTPANEDATVSPLKLVAADIAGVDRVFRAGGVQGVAALAYGTESVPRVQKICGPGNIFVTAAKKRLYGEVGIDGVFGPSETVVVADAAAAPDLVAADILAGAEHDHLATALLITTSEELAVLVGDITDTRLPALAREEAARASLDARGGAIVVDSLAEALDLANEFAPEHLCLHVADLDGALMMVRNAGGVFAGETSVESIGDYTAGPSHVMPTGGSARFASPLGVQDFLKVTSVVRMRQDVVDRIGPPAAAIARAEGLIGHAESIERRGRGTNP